MGERGGPGIEAASTDRPTSRRADAVTQIVIAAVLVAESMLFVAGVQASPLSILLAAHFFIVAVMVVVLQHRMRAGTDGGHALLAIVCTLATGPFGAAGAALLPLLARQNVASDRLLAAWYDRIALSGEQDEFTNLSDRVAIGRAANLAAPAPQSFVDLFKSGPIAEQQAALGLIARSFHPGYLPALKLALDSVEPVIRVQAAAVAARVRGQLNALMATLFARASDPTLTPADAMDVAGELRAAIGSGLLETSEHATARGILEGLLARIFSRFDVRHRKIAAGERVLPERTGDEVDDAYASQLIAQGRFAEFRTIRLAMRRPLRGRYRRRLVVARRASAGYARQLRALSVRV